MIDHLEPSPTRRDDRPAWIEAFLRASHASDVDEGRDQCHYRQVRPHPGATWTQLHTSAVAGR